jgi:phosphopantothenoylcysteine decarboxylase/phosphopantothenate--cysteine ligase
VLTVGFALETEGGRERARAKLEEKGMDFVALNRPEVGLGTPDNEVTLIDRWGGEEDVPRLPKEAVADRILDRVAERVGG